MTPDTIVEEITKEVAKQVNNFIIDFSAANPTLRIKVPPPPRPAQEQPETEKTEPNEPPSSVPTAANPQQKTTQIS